MNGDILLLVVSAGWVAIAAPLEEVVPQQPGSRIYGGSEVAVCGWPTAVSMEGHCTGTLVHPRVVVYAAHCGVSYRYVTFGESIESARMAPVEHCEAHPFFDAIDGFDIAFCVLHDAQDDIPIVPPLMGCEIDVLMDGREVVVVGFGLTEAGGYGTKFEVSTEIAILDDFEVYIGGEGRDSCVGDSGGPVYINLGDARGSDDSWRVFGITSYGGACGSGAWYSMMHVGMRWLEEQSGFDVTPCHTSDGEWEPSAGCGYFPMDPRDPGGAWVDGCSAGAREEVSNSCGPAYDPSSGGRPPVGEGPETLAGGCYVARGAPPIGCVFALIRRRRRRHRASRRYLGRARTRPPGCGRRKLA
jgi:hypothetical protein